MKKKSAKSETEILVAEIVKGLEEKKGKNIVSLDLRGISNSVADFYVVCGGDSNTHVNALSGSVEVEVQKALDDKPWHIEGTSNGLWQAWANGPTYSGSWKDGKHLRANGRLRAQKSVLTHKGERQ